MNTRAWRYWIPGHIACFPLSVGYLLFCLVVYRARSLELREGVLSCVAGTFERDGKTNTRIWGRPGAQTIGAVQCYASEEQRQRGDLRVHENVHIVEAFVVSIGMLAVVPVTWAALGPLTWWTLVVSVFSGPLVYSLAYGVMFLVPWIASGFGPWHDAYRKNPLEVWAYAAQDAWIAIPPHEQIKRWGGR